LTSNTTSILNPEERILLPALKSCARNILNAIKRSLTSKFLSEEEILKEFRTYFRQEDFVKYDNGFATPNRILMLVPNSNLE
jgi:N-acetyl-gamma-glutamylphosphate reductase